MTFLERLASGPPILCDGGTGTERRRTGLSARDVHRSFVEAGAELVVADSITSAGLAVDLPREAAATMATAVDDARRSGATMVAASLGPIPPGTADAVRRERYAALAEAAKQADVLFAETLLSLADADAAVAAARACGMPIAVSFAIGRNGFGYAGLDVEDMARWAARARPDAAGLNCGDAPEPVVAAAERWRRVQREVPFVLRPATGEAAPAGFAVLARSVPARIVGGCCGATVAHIAALADLLR